MQNNEITPIAISYPAEGNLHLIVRVGACRLRIKRGEGSDWVTGTYQDPSNALPYRINQDKGEVRISQDTTRWSDMLGRFTTLPAILELAIGATKSFILTIETGASEADLDLGGLPISRLTIRQGAGKMDLDFSTPNPITMDTFTFSGGASAIEMTDLANAHFAYMTLEGGAAGYKLDFGGTLQQDGRVKINAGVCSVDVKVPPTTAARITSESALAGVEIGDGFMKKDGMFWTEAAVAGAKPELEIRASITMGSLRMTTGMSSR